MVKTAEDKQFISIESKRSNTFCIIIERTVDGRNTAYFLSKMNEADLMVMTEDGKAEIIPLAALVRRNAKQVASMWIVSSAKPSPYMPSRPKQGYKSLCVTIILMERDFINERITF